MKIQVNTSSVGGEPYSVFPAGTVLIITHLSCYDDDLVVGDVAICGGGTCAFVVPRLGRWINCTHDASCRYLFRPLHPGETVTFTGE